jgi:hypothetical protein
MNLCIDVFDFDSTGDAVYADPPYKGQGHRYGCGDIDIPKLIAKMDSIAPRRALSISAPMLVDVLPLFGKCRVMPWVKPQTSFKPNVWPAYTWEPVIFWGDIKADRDMPTPRDHLVAAAHQRRPGQFVTPKPPEFGDWVVRVMLPRPSGKRFIDLFSGSGAIGAVANAYGCEVVSVDNGKAMEVRNVA